MAEAAGVVISGMHSGPNPSPGLGVARSLRLSGMALHITGLDYSGNSSGLHSPLIDRAVQLPPWHEIDLLTWQRQIDELTADPHVLFLPCLDLEVRQLADSIGKHPRVLAPSGRALDLVVKPALTLADALGLPVPRHESDVTPASAAAFLRHAEHGAWVKGQHYEAFRVRTAPEAAHMGEYVAASWGTSWHLEAHVPGQECGLAFAARDGVLLDAVMVNKTLLTSEGKTWSGQVVEPPQRLLDRLRDVLLDTGWSGGGEVELLRGWDGALTLMELNPRFPAWVHGASVCGANLPAALVAGRRSGPPRRALGPGFTRTVEEVAVSAQFGINPYVWSSTSGGTPASKHPSGMPELGRIRRPVLPTRAGRPDRVVYDWPGLPEERPPTPFRLLDLPAFGRRAAVLRAAVAPLAEDVVLAYSVKTCPQPQLLEAAAAFGLVPEVISLDELDTAIKHGLTADRAVLNGPAKWWPFRPSVDCWAFFADSLEELRWLRGRLDEGFHLTAAVVGVRVRAPHRPSRFGLRLDTSAELDETAALVADLSVRLGAKWGGHFHHAQSAVGTAAWERDAAGALARLRLLEARLGEPPAVLDLGGGWHHDDLSLLRPATERVLGPALNRGSVLVLEPGKVLTQSSALVVAEVLTALPRDEPPAVVVDAALGDLPEAPYWQHPVARHRRGEWERLPAGVGRILGRSCMESDVLAEGVELDGLEAGDLLVFGEAGAYDMSMSYAFGRGALVDGLLTL